MLKIHHVYRNWKYFRQECIAWPLRDKMKIKETITNFIGIQSNKEIKYYIFIVFAYLIGIIQDLFLGVRYLLDIWRRIELTGSFPFMTAWGLLMIWGLKKPIERKAVLLFTCILVLFMFIEEISLSYLQENLKIPLIRIFGILLWGIAYAFCWKIEKECERSKTE